MLGAYVSESGACQSGLLVIDGGEGIGWSWLWVGSAGEGSIRIGSDGDEDGCEELISLPENKEIISTNNIKLYVLMFYYVLLFILLN